MKGKIQSLLSMINIPMLVFLAFSTRLILQGASWGDAIAMVAISGLLGFYKHSNKQNILWKSAVEKEITDLKNAMQSVKLDRSTRPIYDKQQKTKRHF